MVKTLELIGRYGNKTNDIKYFKKYLPDPITLSHVVEPFGGSFAVIRNEFINNINFDIKYHVNDNDEQLYYIYTHLEDYKNYVITMNNIMKKHLYNKNRVDYKKFIEEKKEYDIKNNINKHINGFFTLSRIIRGSMCKYVITLKDDSFDEQIKLFKQINFSNNDYKDLFKQYQNNKKAFLFLDPPYLFSDNSTYHNTDLDMTQIIIDIKNFIDDKKTKCKIMLIINKLAIIKWMFDKYIKGEYERTYQIGKKKMKHLIICNYED